MTQPTNPQSLTVDLEIHADVSDEVQNTIALSVGEVFHNNGLTKGIIHVTFKES
jgi:hypothetical protein